MNDVLLKQIFNQGFPTTREEDWKYTNIAPIAKREFRLADAVTIDRKVIQSYILSENYLVYVNGHFTPALSQLPPEVQLKKLDRDAKVNVSADIFTKLNQHFFQDGHAITIEKSLAKPLQIIYVASAEAWIQPRHVITLKENVSASLIESFHGCGANITNTETEIYCRPFAKATYIRLQVEDGAAFHVGRTTFFLDKKSEAISHNFSFGSLLSRNDIVVNFQGEKASCYLYGLYAAKERQHMDHHTAVNHAVPQCKSVELYCGILADKSRGVFNGKVKVAPQASHTEAQQANHNLLLSSEAEIDTKPELEIYHDDVKCTHGATIGQLDETALFYARSRGLSLVEAKNVLIRAFAQKIVEKLPTRELQNSVSRYLDGIL